jgi:hypothetical protein
LPADIAPTEGVPAESNCISDNTVEALTDILTDAVMLVFWDEEGLLSSDSEVVSRRIDESEVRNAIYDVLWNLRFRQNQDGLPEFLPKEVFDSEESKNQNAS